MEKKSPPKVEVNDQYEEEAERWVITEGWESLPLVVSQKDRREGFLLTYVADCKVVSSCLWHVRSSVAAGLSEQFHTAVLSKYVLWKVFVDTEDD